MEGALVDHQVDEFPGARAVRGHDGLLWTVAQAVLRRFPHARPGGFSALLLVPQDEQTVPPQNWPTG
ncbi:hypothetical protein GCM10027030_24760 [Luteococcus sediminum]